MTGPHAITSAGHWDACAPHVTGVVRVVSLVNEPLRKNSADDSTTPRVLPAHRRRQDAARQTILLTLDVAALALDR